MNTSNPKKNLLLIVPMLHQGGFERVCTETARLLQDAFHVKLLIFTDKDAFYDVTGIEVININLPAASGKAGKALNLLRRRHAIRAVKKKHKIDIAYSFGATANLANVMSRTGERVVTSLRSSLDLEDDARMRRVLAGSDLMISCAAKMEKTLRKTYGFEKTAVLYNPLDTEKITALSKADTTAPGAPLIVTMGREDDAKGYWHLLKAFSILRQTFSTASLMIIGSGSFEREHALCDALGIKDNVVFPGAKKNPFALLKAGDIFVLPSNHEGFPNALVEAMALHLPVIACDCVSGPREILLSEEEASDADVRFADGPVRDIIEGAYGMLIPDTDATPDYDASHLTPDDYMFANAMKRMLSDEEKCRRFGQAAGQRAGDFSAGAYAERLTELLMRTLSAD